MTTVYRLNLEGQDNGSSSSDELHERAPLVEPCKITGTSTPKRKHSQTSSSSTPQQPNKKVNITLDAPTEYDELLDFFDNISTQDTDVKEQFETFLNSSLVQNVIQTRISRAVSKELTAVQDEVSFLKGSIDSLINMVHVLQDENKQLKVDIGTLQKENDSLEQYSRRDSLRIHNDWPEYPREDTDAKVIEMTKTHMNMDIRPEDISRSHRVGPNKGTPRPIIVKFVSHRTKSKLYKARGTLKMGGEATSKLFVTEDLTKKRQAMFAEARHLKKQNFIQDCWTTDGNLFVRDAQAKVKIFSDSVTFAKWKANIWANPPATYAEVVQIR